MKEEKRLYGLTPNEEARAKQQAFDAFVREYETHVPQEKPSVADLVHENPRVVKALVGTIGFLPAVLGLIALAAILISSDKTMSAFYNGVSNKQALFGAWAFALSICGVIMTEGALVYAEFAVVRERLKKGLRRRVWNVRDLWRALRVRLGTAEPLDYDEMPDAALVQFSRLIFLIVLGANIYGGYHAAQGSDPVNAYMAVGLGIAGAFSLRFIGAQLAHLTYELVEQRNHDLMAEMEQRWRAELDHRWAVVEAEFTRRALHHAFVVKNELAHDAESPYLLTAGESGEITAIPLQYSRNVSPEALREDWKSGNNQQH